MAWIYLVESQETRSDLASGLIQSLTVKQTDTLNLCSYQECQTDQLSELQSGTTSQRLRPDSLTFLSTSLSGDSLVRTSVLLELEKAWKESEADFFLRSCAWSKKSSPLSCSWKTFQPLELGAFLQSSMNLQKWGMTVGGLVSLPQALEPRTSERDGFCLPTPATIDSGSYFNRSKSAGAKKRPTLGAMAKYNLWPTPTAKEGGVSHGKNKTGAPKLTTVVGGQLNPTWIEWLMGFPLGWSALNDLGMRWCQFKRVKPF